MFRPPAINGQSDLESIDRQGGIWRRGLLIDISCSKGIECIPFSVSFMNTEPGWKFLSSLWIRKQYAPANLVWINSCGSLPMQCLPQQMTSPLQTVSFWWSEMCFIQANSLEISNMTRQNSECESIWPSNFWKLSDTAFISCVAGSSHQVLQFAMTAVLLWSNQLMQYFNSHKFTIVIQDQGVSSRCHSLQKSPDRIPRMIGGQMTSHVACTLSYCPASTQRAGFIDLNIVSLSASVLTLRPAMFAYLWYLLVFVDREMPKTIQTFLLLLMLSTLWFCV